MYTAQYYVEFFNENKKVFIKKQKVKWYIREAFGMRIVLSAWRAYVYTRMRYVYIPLYVYMNEVY